jgi:hypothetical protein
MFNKYDTVKALTGYYKGRTGTIDLIGQNPDTFENIFFVDFGNEEDGSYHDDEIELVEPYDPEPLQSPEKMYDGHYYPKDLISPWS